MDPATHKRYLDYRDRHGYFGGKKAILTADEFARADAEHASLTQKGKARSAADETRLKELSKLLFRD